MAEEIRVVHAVSGEIKTFASKMYAHKFLLANKLYLVYFD